MNNTILIPEMLQFHFGSKIFCSDGEGGFMMQVIFDPATACMTYIEVKQGRLFGKSVYLPFQTILAANREGIPLQVKRSDVAAAGNQEPEGATFKSKSIVENKETSAKGLLMMLAVHPENGALAYVVANGLRQGQDTLVQEQYITSLMKDRITVSIPDETLHALPPYRPDNVLQQEVEAALFDFTPLHIDLKAMNIRVADSILYLDGNISSSLRSDIVQDRVSGVQGLAGIKNRLIADDTLTADVARALGQDERTRDLPIGVYPRVGMIRLSGAVHTSQQKAAAEEIAKNFPGVRSVENNLLVDSNVTMLSVMSAPEGGETKDIVPGKYVRHTQ